jgi:hypothetical protein
MINSLQIAPFYRDTWGYYDAMVNAAFAPLDHNPCYKPKLIEVPDVSLQVLAPGAYLQYNFTVTPGSLILGFLNDDGSPLFVVQITDKSTKLRFWDAPVSNQFLTNTNNSMKLYPSLLSSPRPVVGSGLFTADIYANAQLGGNTRCAFTLMVAEAVECP